MISRGSTKNSNLCAPCFLVYLLCKSLRKCIYSTDEAVEKMVKDIYPNSSILDYHDLNMQFSLNDWLHLSLEESRKIKSNLINRITEDLYREKIDITSFPEKKRKFISVQILYNLKRHLVRYYDKPAYQECYLVDLKESGNIFPDYETPTINMYIGENFFREFLKMFNKNTRYEPEIYALRMKYTTLLEEVIESLNYGMVIKNAIKRYNDLITLESHKRDKALKEVM